MSVIDELRAILQDEVGVSPGEWDALFANFATDAGMNDVMRADWYAASRADEGQVRQYYVDSKMWHVNTFNHGAAVLAALAEGAPVPVADWHQEFARLADPGGAVLDYGGGFFKDTAALAQLGYRVVQAEIAGPVTRFLTRVIAEWGIPRVCVLPVVSDRPDFGPPGSLAGVVCFEVLEHVIDPVGLAAHMVQALRPGAPFMHSVSFGAPEHAPYHVASNAPLSVHGVWDGHLRAMGLAPHWGDAGTHARMWVKL